MSHLSYMEKLLEGVEVEWKALGDIGNFIRGSGIQKSDFTESGVGCIHYGQIHTHYGTWAVETKSFINPEFAARLRKAYTGDLVIATTSEDDAAVAKAVAWLGDEEVAVSTDAYIYRHTINSKYMSYFFQTELFQSQKKPHITGTKVRRISGDSLAKIRIPIPCPENPEKSLQIQAEIVRILDTFTALTAEFTAELTAELTARKKQYTYYRDQLLTFAEGEVEVEWKALGDVCRFINGRAYQKPELLEQGKYPVLRVGNFFTNNNWYYSNLELDEDKYCDNGDLLYAWSASFGPRIWEGEKVIYHYHIWKVVPEIKIVSKKFLFYLLEWDTEALKTAHGTGSTMMHVGKSSIEKRLVPIPSLAEQARIVAILDKFDALTNSIIEHLPREIELRQQQYEYYREQLLSFHKVTSEA